MRSNGYNRTYEPMALYEAASPALQAWMERTPRVKQRTDETLSAFRALSKWAAANQSRLNFEGFTGFIASAIRAMPAEAEPIRKLANLSETGTTDFVSDIAVANGAIPVWAMTLEKFRNRPQGVMSFGFAPWKAPTPPAMSDLQQRLDAQNRAADDERSEKRAVLHKLGVGSWSSYRTEHAQDIRLATGKKKEAWEAFERAENAYYTASAASEPAVQTLRWLESVFYALSHGKSVPYAVQKEAERELGLIQDGVYNYNLPPYLYYDTVRAAEKAERGEWGQPEYHDAMKATFEAIQKLIEKQLIPNLYALGDDLRLMARAGVEGAAFAASDLQNRVNAYQKVFDEKQKRATARVKREQRKGYEQRSPEYAGLISERARLKLEIAEATRLARLTPEFRMMGGLHVLGMTGGLKLRLRDVENRIAAIERTP